VDYRVHTLKDRPDLSAALQQLNRKTWPDFIIKGDTCNWGRLYSELPEFLLVLTDEHDALIAGGFTVPVQWNGTLDDLPPSIEKIIERGLEKRSSLAGALVPIAAVVDRRFRGANLSAEILKQMKFLAVRHGFRHLIVPVRPTWKARYPLQRIERYAQWKNEEGLFYDPWLRAHQRLGATVLKCVDSTLTIRGSIGDWKRWTGLAFPESGAYVVNGALQPVQIDVESDLGVYDEPNVWMRHPLP
jgi:hypothetical protein